MRAFLRIFAFLAGLSAALPAAASCYADYKAKREPPLQLHYGVIELARDPCRADDAARAEVRRRIAVEDWTLLQLRSTFGEDELQEKRRDAGSYFLRY